MPDSASADDALAAIAVITVPVYAFAFAAVSAPVNMAWYAQSCRKQTRQDTSAGCPRRCSRATTAMGVGGNMFWRWNMSGVRRYVPSLVGTSCLDFVRSLSAPRWLTAFMAARKCTLRRWRNAAATHCASSLSRTPSWASPRPRFQYLGELQLFSACDEAPTSSTGLRL